MKHDHLMGYPQAAAWSADAEPIRYRGVVIDFATLEKRFALGLPLRLRPPALVKGKNTGDVSPKLTDYLPTGVTQCTNADRQGISRNPEIRQVRFRGALGDFGRYLQAMLPYDTGD